MNRYLEKIAASKPGLLSRAADFVEHAWGGRTRQLAEDAATLARHEAAGNNAAKVLDMHQGAAKATRDARVKLGVGGAAVGGAGFLGIHKYHQHKDRAIMDRINNMYSDPSAGK